MAYQQIKMQYWYITGASSGLGKALAEKILHQPQVSVIGISRRCAVMHNNYYHHYIDLGNTKSVLEFSFVKHDDADKIILINNAASLGEVKYCGELNEQVISETYHLNIVSPHLLINKFISTYKNTPAQKIIVNVSSGAAVSGYDGWSIYCATKAALQMVSECVAKEFEVAGNNLFKILSVAPGVMETNMQNKIRQVEKKNFSRVNKFIELKADNKLYNTETVAEKFIQIIENANKLKGVTHRIQL